MGLSIPARDAEWLRAHQGRVWCKQCRVFMMLKNTSHGIAYECLSCGARHGAHRKTGEPLGIPAADKETRQARIDAHEALDALWDHPDAVLTRDAAYAYLAMRMGLTVAECHIGRFNVKQCQRVIEACEELV